MTGVITRVKVLSLPPRVGEVSSGHIRPDDGSADLFFHADDVQGPAVALFSRVEFEVDMTTDPRGPRARGVRALDAAPVAPVEPTDVTRVCLSCGHTFVIEVGEQRWMQERGYVLRKRCSDCCRDSRRQHSEAV